jgi:hypothetical protein
VLELKLVCMYVRVCVVCVYVCVRAGAAADMLQVMIVCGGRVDCARAETCVCVCMCVCM